MEKYDIVLDSVSAKQEQLNAKTQEFYNNILSGEVITFFLDLGKGFMDVMNWADGLIGKLILITASTMALIVVKKALLSIPIIQTVTGWITQFIALASAEGVTTAGAVALKKALDLLKSHPIIFVLSIITTLIVVATTAFNAFNVTLEEQHELAQQAQSDYQEVASELESVNEELATTKQRIDELNGKHKLTFTEKEELENLKAQNAELEKRAYWLEKDAEIKRKETSEKAQKAWDKDFNVGAEYSVVEDEVGIETDGDVQVEYGHYSETEWIQQQIKYYNELQTEIDKLVAKEGQWTEEESNRFDILKKNQQGVVDYLEETGARIQTDFIDAYPDVDPSIMQGWKDLRDTIRQALNPQTPTEKLSTLLDEQGKDWNDYYTALAKNGTLAIEDFTDSFKDQIKETFNLDDGDTEGFNNILEEIIAKFQETADSAETVEASFDDLTESISNLHDKYEALKTAQEEYNEHGALSLETLEDISEQYPDMAENIGLYLAGLMSEQELLNALGEAYNTDYENYENLIRSKLALSPQFYEGLTDAQKQNVQALFESYGADFENFKTAEEAKLNFNAQVISKLADRWSKYAGKTVDYLKKEQSELEIVAEKQYRHGMTNTPAQEQYEALTQAINDIEDFESAFDDIIYEGVSFDPQEFINKSLDIGNKDSSSNKSSSSSKEWWETQLEELKKQLDYSEISMDEYISGIQKILGKLKKGSDAWREVNNELQKAKLENVENQFDRGEITIDQYISKLTELRKAYKQGTEGYKELTEKIEDAKLDKTKDWLDDLDKKVESIDQKINQLGDVNTDKEQVKYTDLLSKKYKQVQSNIAKIQKELQKTTLTEEQRVELQEKLNDLLEEEVSIRDEIEDSVREHFENQREYEENNAELTKKQTLYNKEVELYGKEGKELFEYYTQKEIDALNDKADAMEREKEALDKINEREELSNDLLEKKIALQNALNNKTTKILKKQEDGTWQYEYSVNMADVKEAQEAVADAEKALEDYDWEQFVQALRDEADELQDSMDNLAEKYADAEFWADREYEQTMNSIAKAYSDIDALVEKWMTENSSSTDELTTAYKNLTKSNNKLQDKITNLTTAIEGKYETVGDNGKIIPSFDTGGQIKGDGLVIAHDKERVLTPQQNTLFEQLIAKIPQLLQSIDITKFGGLTRRIGGISNGNENSTSTVISKVECVFPNITSTDGLQKAILELPRLALQKK